MMGALQGYAAQYFVKVEAPIYEQPSVSTLILGKIDPWRTSIEDDQTRQKNAPDNWVAIPANTGGIQNPRGWIQRKQLVGTSDLKKVSRCWPVHLSKPISGEAPWTVTFKSNGTAVMESSVGYEKIIGHVYKADGFIYVRANKKRKGSIDLYGNGNWGLAFLFDYNSKKLVPLDYYDADTILFSNFDLKLCPQNY